MHGREKSMITKEEFVKYLNELKENYEILDGLCNNIPYLNVWESFPTLAKVESNYVDMLAKLTEAPTYDLFGYHNDIELYAFCYNYGKDDCVKECKDEHGNVLDFSSPEGLWETIQKSKNDYTVDIPVKLDD